MRFPRLVLALPAATLAVLAGPTSCGNCLTIAFRSLHVAIVDARSKAPITAGSTVRVEGPSFRDSVTFGQGAAFDGLHYTAYENHAGPGWYTITIRKPGYETWKRVGVRVRGGGDCGHVGSATLVTAERTPL